MNDLYCHSFLPRRYSPPHVKRKRKIEEISANFGIRLPVADFYYKLVSQKDTAKKA